MSRSRSRSKTKQELQEEAEIWKAGLQLTCGGMIKLLVMYIVLNRRDCVHS